MLLGKYLIVENHNPKLNLANTNISKSKYSKDFSWFEMQATVNRLAFVHFTSYTLLSVWLKTQINNTKLSNWITCCAYPSVYLSLSLSSVSTTATSNAILIDFKPFIMTGVLDSSARMHGKIDISMKIPINAILTNFQPIPIYKFKMHLIDDFQ